MSKHACVTVLAELILAGLARRDAERMVAGRKAIRVRRVRITEAGGHEALK